MDMGTIASWLAPPFAALLTYVSMRKKSNAEVRKIDAEANALEIINLDKVLTIWKGLSADLSVEVNNLRKEVLMLRLEIITFKKENSGLKDELEKLQEIINTKA